MPATPDAPRGAATLLFERYCAGWRALLLCLAAGALVTVSLAPFGLWPAGIIAALLLRALLEDQSRRTIMWRSWLFGVGLFGSGTSWVYVSIQEHGQASVPLASLLIVLFTFGLALFNLITGWLYSLASHRQAGWNWLLFPACWVLGEWLKSWLLTGFPWLFLGYAHLATPLAGWAPLTGVLGISFVVALTGSILYQLLNSRRPRQLVLLIPLVLLWLGGAGLRHIDWVTPSGEPVQVAMIQPDIQQAMKWRPESYNQIISSYLKQTEALWGTEIIIWPEAAIPRLYQNATQLLEQLDRKAKSSGSTLITGIPYREAAVGDSRPDLYNSVVALGQGSGIYYKQHLVPFGEYVPLEHWLRGLIAFFDLPMSSFSWGPADQAPLRAGERTLAPFVCYEVVYPALVAHDSQHADFILTVSNDSWFGRSIGPHQHFEIARMRALENGRYLIRGTNNGISGLVDHRGAVIHSAPQFTRTVLQGSVVPMQGTTPFGRWGNFPTILLALALTLFAAIPRAAKAS